MKFRNRPDLTEIDVETKAMAERTTILRCLVGSTAHGLEISDQDDRDEMGVCIEDFEAFVGFSTFEQYIERTAALREGSYDARSRPGDLDLTIFSLKKFLRLLLTGNPTKLLLLFVTDPLVRTSEGLELQALAPHIVSRQAGHAFLHYMIQQGERLRGERGQKNVNRPELVEAFGFDTKYVGHVIRLGFQGIELMQTGRITLPMPLAERSLVRSIRFGKLTLQQVTSIASGLEHDLVDAIFGSKLRLEPDAEIIEDWMLQRYLQAWSERKRQTVGHSSTV